MARLRRVSPQMKGWTRRRAGKGFAYLDADGNRLPAQEVERIRSLAIPPAWRDVWICPYPNGHIQALGTDDAGRRQYLYHPDWRTKRDQLKFDRVKVAGARLARARPEAAAAIARVAAREKVTLRSKVLRNLEEPLRLIVARSIAGL